MDNDPENELKSLPVRHGLKRPRESSSPQADRKEPRNEPLIHINKSIFGGEDDDDEEDNSNGDLKEPENERIEEDVKYEDRKVTSKEETGEEVAHNRRSLLNFFEFSNTSKSLPQVVEGGRPMEIAGPAPKLPRIAHYNQHKESDEVKYVEEFRELQERAIPAGETEVSHPHSESIKK